MNFNKKQAALKRPKNFFISLISCFLLVLAFSAQSVVRGAINAATVQLDYSSYPLEGTKGQKLADVKLDGFPMPKRSDNGATIGGTWAWENDSTILNATDEYTAIFIPTDTQYLDKNYCDWKDVGAIVYSDDGSNTPLRVRIPLTVTVTAAGQPETPSETKLYIYIRAVNAD